MELSGHTDNHVVKVRVEVFSFRDVHTIRSLEVVAGHNVVNVVDSSGSESDFEEVSGPDTTVGVFGLILREVRGIHMVVDVSVSFIPLLIIILLKVLMCGVNCEVFSNPAGQLQLFVDLVQKQVILLGNHTVAVSAVSSEDLEPYIINFRNGEEVLRKKRRNKNYAYLF